MNCCHDPKKESSRSVNACATGASRSDGIPRVTGASAEPDVYSLGV